MADISSFHKEQHKRNSDARREQNRQASRNYRQKRKQKLALLDQLLVSDDGQPLNQVGRSGSSASAAANSSAADALAAAHTGSPATSSILVSSDTPRPATSLMDALTNHGWSDMLDLPPERSVEPNASSDERPLPFIADASLRTETLAPTLLRSTASKNSHTQFGGPMGPVLPFPGTEVEPDAEDEAIMDILSGVQSLSLKQKQGLLRKLQREVQGPDNNVAHTKSSPQDFLPNWVSSYARPGPVTTKLQSEVRRFASFVDMYASGTVGPAQLARIYSTEASFFAAVFANCYALGMNDVEPLMVEEGVSIFSLGPDTGYHPSQLAAVRPRYVGVTPDLQPCDVQLTFGHHPYLDVLPFKLFRDKALRALDQDPPLFNEDELCKDLNSGGLVCWGAQQNPQGMEAGVPWDARSWEPKVWFLNKYANFVGGWDDEMWKLARWWHNMRNERIRT